MPYQLKNGVFCPLPVPRLPLCHSGRHRAEDHGHDGAGREREAKNLVRDIAMTKHDAVYGTRHTLRNRRSAGFPALPAHRPAGGEAEPQSREVFYRDFDKGEVILQEGDEATTLCEVIRGSAFADRNRSHRYGIGNCFGASALLANTAGPVT